MDNTGHHSVELYVRTFSTAADTQRETVGRLEALAGDGPIDSLSVERWSDRVDMADDARAVTAFEQFRQWADRHGLSITPPFAVRTYRSAFTGETCDVLVTPVTFLASYVDGELDGLYPHLDGETLRTIDDFVASAERDEPTGSPPAGDTAVIR